VGYSIRISEYNNDLRDHTHAVWWLRFVKEHDLFHSEVSEYEMVLNKYNATLFVNGYRSNSRIKFKTEEDMIAFKLRWCFNG
jgi:hypothetical protein